MRKEMCEEKKKVWAKERTRALDQVRTLLIIPVILTKANQNFALSEIEGQKTQVALKKRFLLFNAFLRAQKQYH